MREQELEMPYKDTIEKYLVMAIGISLIVDHFLREFGYGGLL